MAIAPGADKYQQSCAHEGCEYTLPFTNSSNMRVHESSFLAHKKHFAEHGHSCGACAALLEAREWVVGATPRDYVCRFVATPRGRRRPGCKSSRLLRSADTQTADTSRRVCAQPTASKPSSGTSSRSPCIFTTLASIAPTAPSAKSSSTTGSGRRRSTPDGWGVRSKPRYRAH